MYRKNNNQCARCADTCPFSCFEKRAIYCDDFIPEEYAKLKMSAMEKQAAWADVKAKAEAIVAVGGVEIVEDNAQQVRAYVMSGEVAGEFPVYDGGPYEVILSKKSWENKSNVGGWLQGYLCECKWGQFYSGSPGHGYVGRFCSHAMAALIVSDMRARKDFMGDRTAKVKTLGNCSHCGKYDEIEVDSGLCKECEREYAFEAVAKAIFANDDSDLENIDENLVDQITDEMVVEQRKSANIARWEGYQAIFSVRPFVRKESSKKKVATRQFSYSEIKELEDEVLDKPWLHNADRLKTREGLVDVC